MTQVDPGLPAKRLLTFLLFAYNHLKNNFFLVHTTRAFLSSNSWKFWFSSSVSHIVVEELCSTLHFTEACSIDSCTALWAPDSDWTDGLTEESTSTQIVTPPPQLRCLCWCAQVNFKEVKLGAIIIKKIRFKVSEVISNAQMHMIRSQESEYEKKRPVCQFPRFLKRETVTATFNSINLLVTETPGNYKASRTLIIAGRWHEDESTHSGRLQEQARLKFKY